MSTSLRSVSGALLVSLCIATIPAVTNAQMIQTDRIELPMRPNQTADDFVVISAGVDGLVMFDVVSYNDKYYVEISSIDTALHEVWKGALGLLGNMTPRRQIVRDGVLYILCKDAIKADMSMVVVDLKTKNYKTHVIKSFIPFNPTEFVAAGNNVMIGGIFNYRPFVLHYSIQTEKSKVLPGFYSEHGELLQMRTSDDGTVDIIVAAKNSERRKSLWLRSYDAEGTLLRTTIIEPEEDKNLIFGRSVKTAGNEQVVAGIYGRGTEFARGLFVAHINAYGEYTTSYYNFGDLENFFSYMRASKEKRIRERIERRKIKQKKIRFNYRVLVHELVPYGDEFVLLGEAFFPQYHSLSTGVGSFGRIGRNEYVFDGYQYTHAIVIGFSKSGKLLWDNSFEINDVKTFYHDQFVKIQPEGDHINLLYLFNNVIRSKIIQNGEVLEGKTTEPIKTKSPEDIVGGQLFDKSKLEYWYPGCFYAYGTQRIIHVKDPTSVGLNRVFYINKIVTQTQGH